MPVCSDENVLRLQVTMYQPCLFQNIQGVQKLCGEDLYKLRAQTLELVLLDKLVEIRRQQLEDEAQVVFVDERVPQSQDVVLVLRVALAIQL